MKLSIAHFSREQEFEADKIGIKTIAKAGYDPYAAARFLHEANPIWRLTSLLWTLVVIGLTLFTVHLVWGQRAERRGHGLTFSDFALPIGFFLVAVPWPI